MSKGSMRAAVAGLLVVALGTMAACLSKPIDEKTAAILARADARVWDGCYDCLIEARDLYTGVAVGRARPFVVSRIFETNLLLALREKELALDPSSSFAAARAVVPELPLTTDAARYLQIADLVPPDDIGTPAHDLTAFTAARPVELKTITEDVTWLGADGLSTLRRPVRAYLAWAIDCAQFPQVWRSASGATGSAAAAAFGIGAASADVPNLLRYRRAICGLPDASVLERVHSAAPQFVETSYFLARLVVPRAKDEGPQKARDLLADVSARFSHSPSVTYLAGNLDQLTGDCASALRHFDDTIALRPEHENAWIGRTTCLSIAGRHDEAIVAATHLIDAALLPADGYYWRAWNRHALTQLDAARADVDRAKSFGFTADRFRLAGIIEHDQGDLGPAEQDLVAVRRSFSVRPDCVTLWYLASVYVKGKRFGDAAPAFVAAMGCYATNVASDRAERRKIEARTDLDDTFRRAQVAAFQLAEHEDESQQYASAFNAANYFAQSGQVAPAREYLDIAAHDATLATLVAQLRAIIK